MHVCVVGACMRGCVRALTHTRPRIHVRAWCSGCGMGGDGGVCTPSENARQAAFKVPFSKALLHSAMHPADCSWSVRKGCGLMAVQFTGPTATAPEQERAARPIENTMIAACGISLSTNASGLDECFGRLN